MVKLLTVCATCGWDWLAWICFNCGGTTPRKASQAVIRRLRESYEQRKQEPKTP